MLSDIKLSTHTSGKKIFWFNWNRHESNTSGFEPNRGIVVSTSFAQQENGHEKKSSTTAESFDEQKQ
jgi:hypothetical protein